MADDSLGGVSPLPYLRPLMSAILDDVSPVVDALYGVLDTSYAAEATALAAVRASLDPRDADGTDLDNLGARINITRLPDEVGATGDDDYRRRLVAGPAPNPSTKAGLAHAVFALTNVATTVVTDRPGHFVVTIFGNTPRAAQVLPLVRRLKAAGMRASGQMIVPRPATNRLGQLRLGSGRLGGASSVIALPDAPPTILVPATITYNTPSLAYRTSGMKRHARLGQAPLGTVALGS